ncbi:MAG: PAS domain S-box protein [Candidatus Sumerlaeia bacterium]
MEQEEKDRISELEEEVRGLKERLRFLEDGSESRLAQVLDSISEAFFHLDTDMVVLFFNRAAERLLRKQREDVLGQNLFDAFPPARGSIFEKNYKWALERRKPIFFETFFGEDPYTNWYDVRVYPSDGGISVFFQVTTERKKAEASLKKSESEYRMLAENASDIITRFDNKGNCLYASPALELILGYERSELEGKHGLIVVHAEDQQRVQKFFENLVEVGGESIIEARYVHKMGHIVWLETTARIIRDASGDPGEQICISRDITERKKVELALRENEERLKTAQRIARVGDWIYDFRTGEHFWSDMVYEIYGLDPAQSPPDYESMMQILDDKERAEMERCIQQALEEKKPYQFDFAPQGEYEGKYLSITARPVLDEKGEVAKLIGTLQDITQRKRTEQQLKESRERYEAVTNSIPEVIYVVDSEGIFHYMNAAGIRINNIAPEKIPGLSEFDLFSPDIARKHIKIVRKVITSGKPLEVEDTTESAQGEHRVFLTTLIPITESAYSNMVLGISRDITDEICAKEERRSLERKVQHAQKLESLGVLAGGIAHDFNNLLMSILGNADLALLELSPVSPARQNLIEIESASRRAADLCKQMLAYSGHGKFIITNLDLNEIVEEMTHLLEVSINKKAIMRYKLQPELPPVQGDATQIRQVIMNLITNSSDAIGDKSGLITISTGYLNCDAEYLEHTFFDEDLQPGDYVFLEVSDTGVGMDRETQEKIFDPFFTTKFTGRGLGLAAVMGIVRGHNGALKVYSEPGKGTSFKMLLPASKDTKIQSLEEAHNETDWKSSELVLLVDDEPSVQSVGKRMLNRIGMEVILAMDGKEAIEIFKEYQDRIALVLLDMTMPHMDGVETFRELRRIRPDVQVVISSGYNEQEILNQFSGKNLAGFIQKPYRMQNLKAVLQKAMKEN